MSIDGMKLCQTKCPKCVASVSIPTKVLPSLSPMPPSLWIAPGSDAC